MEMLRLGSLFSGRRYHSIEPLPTRTSKGGTEWDPVAPATYRRRDR